MEKEQQEPAWSTRWALFWTVVFLLVAIFRSLDDSSPSNARVTWELDEGIESVSTE